MSDSPTSQAKDLKNLNQAVIQLSKKFLLGHQKSQVKQKQGIVFIGNSRIGKSTISAIISGLKMHIALNVSEFKIEPKEYKYRSNKNIIQHTLTSVTEFPNIYQAKIDGKLFTVVDLPGFKDTSYEKELCNWHYIKSILQQLDKILFVMVTQVHTDTKHLQDFELQMMQRFAQAFPCKQPHQPKKNLITIVNFMQNIENEKSQDAAKTQIKQNVEAQLQQLKLRQFYSKSFDHDRIFLMGKIKKKGLSQKQIKEGSDYENPRLQEYIRKNVALMEQTQHSSFKINLTKQMNEKSKNLRKTLEIITSKMIKDIGEKFGIYKSLFTNLLTRMAQTDGVICDKKEYEQLTTYYKENNLEDYKKIGIYFGSSSLDNSQRKEEDIVHEIGFHFHQMHELSNSEAQFQKKIEWANQISSKFMSLVQSLCTKLFKTFDLELIEEMTKEIRKSIHIDCQNLIYIFESVENFAIQSYVVANFDFKQHCQGLNVDMYDKIRRVSSFKPTLKEYFSKLLKYYEKLPVRKIDLKNLQRLEQSCNIFNFVHLKYQVIILIYKTHHKKLLLPEIYNNAQVFYEILGQINKKQRKKDQVDKIQAWKKTSSEWQQIKNKESVLFLRKLKQINTKRYEIAQFYLKLDHSFEDFIELLEIIVDDTEIQGANKKKAFDLCLRASEHLAKHWQLLLADKCCSLATKIYLFNDKENVIEAKMKSIELKNRMRAPINEPQVRAQLEKNPWVSISDSDYERLVALLIDSKDLIEQQKKELSETQMMKLASSQSNKNIEKERSSYSIEDSPVKSPMQSPSVAKEEEEKKPARTRRSLKD